MKTNKNGFFITGLIAMVSFIALIIFFDITLISTIAGGIFTSGFVSAIICFITCRSLLKSTIREVVTIIYQMNELTFSNLYSPSSNADLKQVQGALGIAKTELYKAYILTLECIEGAIVTCKTKSTLYSFVTLIENKLSSLQELEYYIEIYPTEAATSTEKLYKALDSEVSDQSFFDNAIKLARLYYFDVRTYATNQDKTGFANRFKEKWI